MSQYIVYPTILARVKSGGYLLDVGCCLGQELRKLVHDGATASNLYGLDTDQGFLDLGFEFFRDKETSGIHFMVSDFLEKNDEVSKSVPKMDIVHLGLFLHLFDWDKQVEACEKVIRLLKPEKRVLIIGQQMGMLEAREDIRGTKKIFAHNVESFKRLWIEIGQKTQTEWNVKAQLDDGLAPSEENGQWIPPDRRRLVFEVERL
ncbi:hypothetical protein HYALB_00011818 [Hymenoscyphus albidus]|uniref:Methyltransferase domain-containing protein n=1 Tax=Hymenoscyphus albidus TaxID=595503 RepID=A0A9N9LS75_9HELO|nr:hypothetical protein HYALB_00011818 [Hymenoscyphus albidus]